MAERVWVVYHRDWYLFVDAIFDSELEAYRWASDYQYVASVPLGVDVREAIDGS